MNGGILTPAHNAAVEAERGLPSGTLIHIYQRREDLIRAAGRALFAQLRYAPATRDQLRKAVRNHFVSRMAAALELHMPMWVEYATVVPGPSREQIMQQVDGIQEPMMRGLPAWFTPQHNSWLASITGLDVYEILESYQQSPNVQRIVEEIRIGGPAPTYGELFTPPPYSPPRPRTSAEQRAFGDPFIRRPWISRRRHLGDRYNNSELPDSIAAADPSNWVFPTHRAPPAEGGTSSDSPPSYSNVVREATNDQTSRRARFYAAAVTGRVSELLPPFNTETMWENDSADSDENLMSVLGNYLRSDVFAPLSPLFPGPSEYRRPSSSSPSNARAQAAFPRTSSMYASGRPLRQRRGGHGRRVRFASLPSSSSQKAPASTNSGPQQVSPNWWPVIQSQARPQSVARYEDLANAARQATEIERLINQVRDTDNADYSPIVETATETEADSESEFEGFSDDVEVEPETPVQHGSVARRKSSEVGPAKRTRSRTQNRG
ncbi:hypothetical protein BST61_g4084 [Cercospora zeina]